MGILGWATGGASGFGPSKVYDSLPYKGWKEISTWLEEAVDAIGLELDWRNLKFFSSAARANLLDPAYTPGSLDPADTNIANATTAPTSAVSRDSMLDVMLFIALGYYPADTNLTVAVKQALAQVGWTALRRKGTRLQMLNLASKLTDVIAYGWTVPPFNFSIIANDGTPSPGQGVWTPPNSTTNSINRPWFMQAIRRLLGNGMAPDWAQFGVGYSQFRAGYSAAGETVFSASSRINLLAHEHFDSWSIGVPVGWTQLGSGTLTQSTTASQINWEFTGNAAVFDLTAASKGTFTGLTQTVGNINNQIVHRFHLDYAYTNAQNAGVLVVQITDANRNGTTYYYNNSTNTWQSTVYNIVAPVSALRGRLAFDVTMQPSNNTNSIEGTTALSVVVQATSDGTATTKTTYTIYRVGLYEKFDIASESAAFGERTLWLPLIDAPGWSTARRATGTGVLLEPANADRSSYKLMQTSTTASFPYHPALSAHGYRAHAAWTNLIKGSNDFGTDWTLTNATKTANANISPLVGETSPSAPTLAATSTAAKISQATGLTPTSKTYCGGVWVKKLSSDVNFNDVTISLVSTSTKSQAFTLKQSQGWQLLPFNLTFGVGDVAAMSVQIAWGAASSTGQIAVADAYLYDVTGNTGVLYPPVARSSAGSTGTLGASSCQAQTANQNVSVLHALTQRTLASVVRGELGLMIVPTYDAASQPNGVIFDCAQAAAQNRIVLRVASGVLELRRWDNSGNQWVTSLTMSQSPAPAAGSLTWQRDKSIQVRCLWDQNSTLLSAGNGSATPGTKPGTWNPLDTSVAAIGVGNDWQSSSANQFDGMVTLLEVDQLGTATS